jgi:hypothetical protein
MYYRHAVGMVVAGVLASSGYAMAEAPQLSLDPSVITAADATAPQGMIMQGLDKIGLGKALADAKLNLYGWMEGGYTYNHRHSSVNNTSWESTYLSPGPFDHEFHNHFMFNQLVLRVERQVDTNAFDVGGMVEFMYGSDAAQIHATGLGYNGTDETADFNPNDNWQTFDNLWPTWQFDIPQAYITVNIPVLNGVQLMAGKFVTLLGYESIDPRANPFYSHSYLFAPLPRTHLGLLGSVQINEQLGVKVGVTRGWDIALEDNNDDALDVIGQVSFKFNNQMNAVLNFSVGPENGVTYAGYSDPGHYRIAVNPILRWQVTDAFKIGLEGLYIFDGGYNGWEMEEYHAYGDVWGVALYAGYTINENVTLNARVGKFHSYVDGYDNGGLWLDVPGVPTINVYDITLGATFTPLPQDTNLKGFSIRPEIRYQISEDPVFGAKGRYFKDQLTFGLDMIFKF